jgi:vacuole morphology and inheritance protein 14
MLSGISENNENDKSDDLSLASFPSSVEIERKYPFNLFGQILDIILKSSNISSKEKDKKEKKILEEIEKIAKESNNTLLNIIEYYNENNENLTLFEEILIKYFEYEEPIILKIVFKWIERLYNKFHENAFVSFDDFMEKFTFILANKNDEIFKEAINIICYIIKDNEKNINIIVSKIINTFQKKIDLIDKRGTDIFTILCSTLRVDTIFLTFATVLLEMKDNKYIGRIINRLNIFLIKSDITEDLRNVCKKVKNRNDRKDKIFFEKIFTTWCINPVSVLTLCLIAENFELSYNLLIKMYIIFFI